MSNPHSNPAEFRPHDNSDSASQPGFLDHIDSALGLHMAEQSSNDAKNAKNINSLTITDAEGKDTHAGQLVSSPLTSTQEIKPSSAPIRPGFFGAGGSMYVIWSAYSRNVRF